MPKQHKILIFDSGAGGLSVAQEILKKTRGCILTYFADKARFPYGELTEADLTQRVCYLIGNALLELQPDIVIIACNTASTIALEALREQFNVPFIGVVPAIKPAALQTLTGSIGLLATEATVNRKYTDALIQKFAKSVNVSLLGSNQLVIEAESFIRNGECNDTRLKQILEAFLDQDSPSQIDTIVLACTHFPLIKERLNNALPENISVQWIDSGEAISRRVASLLHNTSNITSGQPTETTHINFHVTGQSMREIRILCADYFNFLAREDKDITLGKVKQLNP